MKLQLAKAGSGGEKPHWDLKMLQLRNCKATLVHSCKGRVVHPNKVRVDRGALGSWGQRCGRVLGSRAILPCFPSIKANMVAVDTAAQHSLAHAPTHPFIYTQHAHIHTPHTPICVHPGSHVVQEPEPRYHLRNLFENLTAEGGKR